MGDPPPSYAVVLDDGSLTPRGTYLGYPDLGSLDITTQKFGYTLTHEFNDNWKIRNNLAIVNSDTKEAQVLSYSPPIDDRFLFIEAYKNDYITDNYFGQIDLLGKFKTGSISHQILAGFDFNRITEDFFGVFDTNLPRLDIFDPNYDVPEPNYQPSIKFLETIQTYGVYLQDQITLSDNFKLLLGGRYDWTSYENDVADFGAFGNTIEDPLQTDGAFSPRMGLVYQPSETVSVYASYSQSFRQTTGFNPDGTEFKPTRGTQYEVGVKADFLEGRLSTNLALYHLIKLFKIIGFILWIRIIGIETIVYWESML